ncbi:3-deoxy-7-phosphoheptulonate synthase [Sphingomonas sp. NSE70-1]|uniref:Phospho-2-dehydro-3-deoxyheptonate aldolase n=1 Tax=Sphingomonas caseinilyticus TaxID=2908205 RepID=A0ABT0RU89_9SPHN|nr:3-deoxy-7-phosphoheptulonate synthase [Sphingomonas caseinilyticus]MCL6698582.1 3-deoxy-7-phosphoheptulonate synthase [Sphingomonas caseinilyticus]
MSATLVSNLGWYPASWRRFPANQMPSYGEPEQLKSVEARLEAAAPVIAFQDAQRLRQAMAGLAEGRGFLLQGGDCAESFDDPVAEQVSGIVGLFEEMAAKIRPAVNGPLIEVARIAGQFAKPRSAQTETHEGETLPAYRGDIVNGTSFDALSRRADPQRMIRAHMQSVGTAASLAAARGSDPPIFTSHEALLLPYEEPLTRRDPAGRWWATSGHMLWLGDRTRQVDGAHVEYLRGIENVVGVKCGPSLQPEELCRLIDRLDPVGSPGKLVLIGRFGAKKIRQLLPPLMRAAKDRPVVWTIDPMHGNTSMTGKRKVRRLPDILAEIDAFFAIAQAEGVHGGGVHLEMSALDVTECIGGRGPASIAELDKNWLTACDPRLNRAQAIDLAAHIAALMA